MTILSSVVKVGIADLQVTTTPNKLKTSGLGSCVGVVIYDQNIAGLAHVMLPDSTVSKKSNQNVMKYADTAIDLMLDKMVIQGARKNRLKAKLAGGAHMFSFQSSKNTLKIGERNVEAVLLKLKELNIPLIAHDVGGDKGRTIEFDIETHLLEIRTVHSGVTSI